MLLWAPNYRSLQVGCKPKPNTSDAGADLLWRSERWICAHTNANGNTCTSFRALGPWMLFMHGQRASLVEGAEGRQGSAFF